MIAEMISSGMPEPVRALVTSDEVISALGAFVLMGLSWVTFRIKRSLDAMKGTLDQTHSQVTNKHKTNLRDDVDGVSAEVKREFGLLRTEMEKMQSAQQQDAAARERRDQRAEDQIDGLRDDMRQLTERADRDHRVINERINQVKKAFSTNQRGD